MFLHQLFPFGIVRNWEIQISCINDIKVRSLTWIIAASESYTKHLPIYLVTSKFGLCTLRSWAVSGLWSLMKDGVERSPWKLLYILCMHKFVNPNRRLSKSHILQVTIHVLYTSHTVPKANWEGHGLEKGTFLRRVN